MRILVCGGRHFGHSRRESDIIAAWIATLDRDTTMIIHGNARGTDRVAAGIARRSGFGVAAFDALWDDEGRGAGPIRNRRMLDAGEPHLVVAFPGGTGTANMIDQARRRGIEVQEINNANYEGDEP